MYSTVFANRLEADFDADLKRRGRQLMTMSCLFVNSSSCGWRDLATTSVLIGRLDERPDRWDQSGRSRPTMLSRCFMSSHGHKPTDDITGY